MIGKNEKYELERERDFWKRKFLQTYLEKHLSSIVSILDEFKSHCDTAVFGMISRETVDKYLSRLFDAVKGVK